SLGAAAAFRTTTKPPCRCRHQRLPGVQGQPHGARAETRPDRRSTGRPRRAPAHRRDDEQPAIAGRREQYWFRSRLGTTGLVRIETFGQCVGQQRDIADLAYLGKLSALGRMPGKTTVVNEWARP